MRQRHSTIFKGGWRRRLREKEGAARGGPLAEGVYAMGKEEAVKGKDNMEGTGLMLDGVVVERKRRMVKLKASGEEKAVRSFAFLAGGTVYSLDVWDDRADYVVGNRYRLAIRVKSVSYGRVNLNPEHDASRAETKY